MIWSYRALNNPVARKKWLGFVALLIIVGFAYTAYKIAAGYPAGKALIVASIFTLFVSLYAIISLGKPRHYYIEGNVVHYKPFKTDLSKVRGYEVSEEKLLIKLDVPGIFKVKTLYFENIDDLKQVEKYLNRMIIGT